jgi:hypothetical protein
VQCIFLIKKLWSDGSMIKVVTLLSTSSSSIFTYATVAANVTFECLSSSTDSLWTRGKQGLQCGVFGVLFALHLTPSVTTV